MQLFPLSPFTIGQILVAPQSTGHELRHRDDAALPAASLASHDDPESAAALALYDDANAYRPLKTAPNLRHGWRLLVTSPAALALALDLFYPARLGAWRLHRQSRLVTTPLRDTLARQSGMYRVTQKLTDAQADTLAGRFCRSDGGCLRTILWRRDASGTAPSTLLPPEKYDPTHDQTGHAPGEFIPLLCQEACNLLVAEARTVVKGKPAAGEDGP